MPPLGSQRYRTQKLKEHYGIEVSASTRWSIVLQHAQAIDECPQAAAQILERDGVAQPIAEKPRNAKHMLALRVCRANQEWDSYWQSRREQAA